MSNAQSTPYKSLKELMVLKEWFFDKEDKRTRAIRRVQAYLSRGNVPHSIEATSTLVSSILLDESLQRGELSDPMPVRLAYTMAIIKFVNGLLDPYQRSKFTIPLHKLAQDLGLPSYFVEIRHVGTHESLPSLAMLRMTARNALVWLRENYWEEALQATENEENAMAKSLAEQDAVFVKNVKREMKTFSKLRKEYAWAEMKKHDTSQDATQFWESVKALNALYTQDKELLLDALFSQGVFIVKDSLSQSKINGLLKFYGPLVDKMGKSVEFLRYLLNLDLQPRDGSNETMQQAQWIKYLIGIVPEADAETLFNERDSFTVNNRLKFLEAYKPKDESLQKKINFLIQKTKFAMLNEEGENEEQKKRPSESEDSPAKKAKTAPETLLWSKQSNWDFKPYGIP